jgi:hypothetical protein
MGAASHHLDDRAARADRWLDSAGGQMGTVEPEWWLRMNCGQLAEEISPDQGSLIQRMARRVLAGVQRRGRDDGAGR